MGTTVNDLVQQFYGFSVEIGHGRFSLPGWFPHGETDLRCGLCGHAGTVVFRKHYVVGGDVYGGRAYHYWAIACDSCESVAWLTNLEPELRKEYREWAADSEFECPDCDEPSGGDFLVLANSRKVGHHCIAVVDNEGGWIRPVSDAHEGALTSEQCWLSAEGRMVAPLDAVEATFGATVGRAYQPEDRENPDEWRLVDSPASPSSIRSWLERTLDHDADFIARGRPDRISEAEVAAQPLDSSLALVAPTVSEWCIRRTMTGGRQTRVSFTLDGITDDDGDLTLFDLSVTDPVWEKRVRDKAGAEFRCFTSQELDVPTDEQMYFTLSLGEPFRGDHYKLVAAVILPVPALD